MQESPPQGGFASDLGSELGSVEDAAGYELRQQLRAAAAASLAVAAELRACQAERDRALVERDQAIAAAAELRVAGQRGEAQLFRNAEALQNASCTSRARARRAGWRAGVRGRVARARRAVGLAVYSRARIRE